MSTTSASVSHLSRRATALAALVLALFGTAAFTTAAQADFTLNSGRITLTAGSTTGTPPSGSWVSLPSDHGGNAYFTNPSSTWTGSAATDGLYTLIRPGAAPAGLLLGGTQPSGGIIGSTTDTFGFAPWSLITTSAPSLTFDGTANGTGTRALTGGDLSGLRVLYGGTTYNVATGFGAGAHRIRTLTGEIVGSTTGSNTVRLNWTTDLTEPGFATYRAQFQLVGTYHP
jgi:hypothetical protein